jgi:hypothetical protein
MPALAPRRTRIAGVVGVALLAPIFAELIQAYLGDLGGVFGMLFFVVFLAPLYGGAALLIREVAVRTGRGWPCRLLLATAFGVAMPTLVDVSLFTPSNPDIDYWDDIMSSAVVGGVSLYAVVSWIGGHILMSISAPLAVVESLVRAPGPWLSRTGIAVTAVLMVAVAAAIHADSVGSNEVDATALRYAVSVAVVVALVAAALSPLGRPVRRRTGKVWLPSPLGCAGIGFLGMIAFDLAPISWAGVALDLSVLVVGGLLVLRWSRDARWGQRHVAALAFGGILARTLVGFLAPLPADTSWAEKVTQNTSYLLLVLALGVALERRTRGDDAAYPRMSA